MDSPDPRSGVKAVFAIMRKVTRIVQLAPFAYMLLLAVYLLCESIMPEWALRLSDNLFNIPAGVFAGMMVFGRLLKLCQWYRAACILPTGTKIEGYIDSYVVTFTQNEVILINACLAFLFLAFIILAYRHFFHGRKGNHPANA